GVVADIRRAFLQIGLSELDRPYLKFLWWEEGDPAKPKVFQHRRVVFGLSCSPYLLGATIRFHLQNVPHNFEKTAALLLESFYVDNCVTSVDNHEELEKFIEESKTVLSTAKFELRGWEHSYSDLESYDLLPPEGKSISVLGLRWHLKTDSLTIDLRDCVEDDTPVTKRKILSTVHKIFDPLGFTCPVTLGPKVLLQKCWKLKVSWNTELPASISKKFERWRKELSKLNKIEIPRCLIPSRNAPGNLTFHVFCDANDVNDLTPLTPSMFLHDLKQEGIPDLDILDSSSLNKRHAYRQRVKQDLRKRFRTEYLGHLRQSSKFDKNQKPLQIGDIVLVSSDNTKRIEWPLAKVMELYPSKDGSIRLVKVKMKSGEFLRPVLRLIPLEVTQKVDLGKPPVDRIFPTNEPTVQLTGKECSSETIPDEPDVQRTVNDFSSETVPEKRSRYGRLIKQIVRI
ncbi:uncharacterized protein TNIN_382121, partial [Trichonephila inaurata madagascariensis]